MVVFNVEPHLRALSPCQTPWVTCVSCISPEKKKTTRMNDHRYMEYVIQFYMINDHRMNDHIYYMELSNYPIAHYNWITPYNGILWITPHYNWITPITPITNCCFIWSWGNFVS